MQNTLQAYRLKIFSNSSQVFRISLQLPQAPDQIPPEPGRDATRTHRRAIKIQHHHEPTSPSIPTPPQTHQTPGSTHFLHGCAIRPSGASDQRIGHEDIASRKSCHTIFTGGALMTVPGGGTPTVPTTLYVVCTVQGGESYI